MSLDTQTTSTSKPMLWTGRIISTVLALFMLMGGALNLIKPAFVVEGTAKMGFSENVIAPLGIVILVITILYLIPRTSVLGAILLTGYFGGAVATHVRTWEGWFPVLFAFFFGVLAWLGLFLRDARLRILIPLRSRLESSTD